MQPISQRRNKSFERHEKIVEQQKLQPQNQQKSIDAHVGKRNAQKMFTYTHTFLSRDTIRIATPQDADCRVFFSFDPDTHVSVLIAPMAELHLFQQMIVHIGQCALLYPFMVYDNTNNTLSCHNSIIFMLYRLFSLFTKTGGSW
jgi:hypothetical protein